MKSLFCHYEFGFLALQINDILLIQAQNQLLTYTLFNFIL